MAKHYGIITAKRLRQLTLALFWLLVISIVRSSLMSDLSAATHMCEFAVP